MSYSKFRCKKLYKNSLKNITLKSRISFSIYWSSYKILVVISRIKLSISSKDRMIKSKIRMIDKFKNKPFYLKKLIRNKKWFSNKNFSNRLKLKIVSKMNKFFKNM
jgi:hypothetical protein